MKKKYFAIIFILSAFFIVLIGILIYRAYAQKQNVFDQMYYTRVHTDFDWWSSKNYRGLFKNMEQLENISRDNEDSYTNYGHFVENYKADCLENGAELEIHFYSDNQDQSSVSSGMIIIYETNVQDDENSKGYSYRYNLKDKTLTYTTNDPKNTHKDFLYTIFLKDWFESNPNAGFSMDNLGEFTVIEGE